MPYTLRVTDAENSENVFDYYFKFNDLRSIFIDNMQSMLVEMFDEIRDYEESNDEDGIENDD